jgi:hypothetical protein
MLDAISIFIAFRISLNREPDKIKFAKQKTDVNKMSNNNKRKNESKEKKINKENRL